MAKLAIARAAKRQLLPSCSTHFTRGPSAFSSTNNSIISGLEDRFAIARVASILHRASDEEQSEIKGATPRSSRNRECVSITSKRFAIAQHEFRSTTSSPDTNILINVDIALYEISSLFSSWDERQFSTAATSCTISLLFDRDMRIRGSKMPFCNRSFRFSTVVHNPRTEARDCRCVSISSQQASATSTSIPPPSTICEWYWQLEVILASANAAYFEASNSCTLQQFLSIVINASTHFASTIVSCVAGSASKLPIANAEYCLPMESASSFPTYWTRPATTPSSVTISLQSDFVAAVFAIASAANCCASASCAVIRILTRVSTPPFFTIRSCNSAWVERSARPNVTSRVSRKFLTRRPLATNDSSTFISSFLQRCSLWN